jgi:hypothetical protein
MIRDSQTAMRGDLGLNLILMMEQQGLGGGIEARCS